MGTGSVTGWNHSLLNWLNCRSCSARERLESSEVGGGASTRSPSALTTGLSWFHPAAKGEDTSWAYIVPKVGTTRQSSCKCVSLWLCAIERKKSFYRQKVIVRVVEDPDGALADELGVEDLGDEDVCPALHVQAGAQADVGGALADQLDLNKK